MELEVAPIIIPLLLLTLYFLPTIIAAVRGKCSTQSILTLNLLLGWTVFGWAFALLCALLPSPAREHRQTSQPMAFRGITVTDPGR